MARIEIKLEMEIADTDATYKQILEFIWFYVCQEGEIGPSNPLYESDYQVTRFDFDHA